MKNKQLFTFASAPSASDTYHWSFITIFYTTQVFLHFFCDFYFPIENYHIDENFMVVRSHVTIENFEFMAIQPQNMFILVNFLTFEAKKISILSTFYCIKIFIKYFTN